MTINQVVVQCMGCDRRAIINLYSGIDLPNYCPNCAARSLREACAEGDCDAVNRAEANDISTDLYQFVEWV